jgi:hypothetical protein
MTTAAQLRKIALAMPETLEGSHSGQPDFRVRGKIFAELPVALPGCAVLKLTPEAQTMLIDAKPTTFSPAAGAWGRGGWTRVDLRQTELAELRDLIAQAYERVAPKLASKRAPAAKAKTAPAAKAKRARQR